jgi:hypothetical protein
MRDSQSRKCDDTGQAYPFTLHYITLHYTHARTHAHTHTHTHKYTVTGQPIVGLRKGALLGSRPLNASRPNTRYAAVGEAGSSLCRCDDVMQQHWNMVPAQQGAMTSHSSTLASEATLL